MPPTSQPFYFLMNIGFSGIERTADQEQDRRQTCLPEGLSAESADCEALRASRQADEIRSALARPTSAAGLGQNVSGQGLITISTRH